jgi:hypothetical protein
VARTGLHSGYKSSNETPVNKPKLFLLMCQRLHVIKIFCNSTISLCSLEDILAHPVGRNLKTLETTIRTHLHCLHGPTLLSHALYCDTFWPLYMGILHVNDFKHCQTATQSPYFFTTVCGSISKYRVTARFCSQASMGSKSGWC